MAHKAILQRGLVLPIPSAMPGPKLSVIVALPMCIFASSVWPTLAALIILLLPWTGSRIAVRRLCKWAILSLFAGSLAFVFSAASSGSSITQHGIVGARVSATILVLILTGIRYEASVGALELLHLVSKLGGSRVFAVPLLSAFRLVDLLRVSWQEMVIGLVARGFLRSGHGKRGSFWAATQALVTLFDGFFRRVDSLALAIDLRCGVDGPILIRIEKPTRALDIVLLSMSAAYLAWVFVA